MPVTPQTAQHFEILAAIAGALALFALYRFFARLRTDRAVADTPLVHLRSAAQGYVKVVGVSRPPGAAPTAAPLSRRPCVWWDFQVAEEHRDSKGRKYWDTVERATSVEPFVLADEDSQCLVGPVHADVTPTLHNVWYGNSSRPMNAPPLESTALFSSGPFRYTERLLGVGAQLCVLGELRSQSETGDVSAATAAKLHEWKQDQKTLLARFDADHDGVLSAAEWDAARRAAARECEGENLGSNIQRVSVISEPADGRPFLIAPMSPEKLERRERYRAWLYFAFGLACVLVCAWALSQALS
ncbi:MAG: GIDE domain-containing protein [Steroidobacteraceae bacterium]